MQQTPTDFHVTIAGEKSSPAVRIWRCEIKCLNLPPAFSGMEFGVRIYI